MSDSSSECAAVNDQNKLGPRPKLEHYLLAGEAAYLQEYGRVPEFCPGEVEKMLDDDDESSFNDDAVPPSEEEFFSSDWEEVNADYYVPPLTRRKRALIYQLLANEPSDKDPPADTIRKRRLREDALEDFKNYVLKKRAIKAYRRLKKLKDANIMNPEQAAFFLEKLELKDKKLIRPFYYESLEPHCYKKLLKKRKRAVRRKYEMYALSPEYRTDLQVRTFACIRNIISMGNISSDRVSEMVNEAENIHKKMDEELDQEIAELKDNLSLNQGDSTWPFESELSVSSFFDDEICESEMPFLSSPFEEDDLPRPQPDSRRLRKYRRMINKCEPLSEDDETDRKRKLLRRAEIDADLRNYIEWRRATKAVIRYKVAKSNAFGDDRVEEALNLLSMEILDKKLDRDYYYSPDEPECYKELLGKRWRAIARKHERYAIDPEYQREYEKNIYANYLRIQESKYFGKKSGCESKSGSEDDDESSFNDTEIPTSEYEVMSETSLRLPSNYEKPITRTKAAIFKVLDYFEIDTLYDTAETVMKKRRARLNVIKDYKALLKERRIEKAAKRLQIVNKMGIKDPGQRAIKLKHLEERDKKLNRGYYYRPDEPEEFKELLNRRLRAITKKYGLYYQVPGYRKFMEERIIEQAKTGANWSEPEKDANLPIPIGGGGADDPDLLLDPQILNRKSDGERPRRNMPLTHEDMMEMPLYGDDTMTGGSFIEDNRKKERQRQYKTAGISKPYRESAPPGAQRVHGFDDISLFYGQDKSFDRYYQKCLLVPSASNSSNG